MIATLAVLTPNFARFAIVGAIVLIAFYLVMFAVQMVLLVRNPQSYVSTLASLEASRGLVGSLLMMSFGCGVVLVQYLTRRFRLAITLAVASVMLSMLAQYVWPWDFLMPSVDLVQDTGFKADSIGAALIPPIQANDQATLRGGTPLKQVQGNIDFKNNPKGYIIQIGAIDSHLKTADGQNIALQTSNQQASVAYSGIIDPDAVEFGLGGVPILNMDTSYPFSPPLFDVDAGTYERYASTPLDFSASLDCTAYKYVVVTELPLTKGARFDRGSEHLVVTDVLDQPNGVDLILRQRKVHLLFAPKGQDTNAYQQQSQNSVIYVLLNKARRQAVIQKRNTSFDFSITNEGILRNAPLRISFGPDDNNSRSWLAPQLDKAWLADAVLVRLDLTQVAKFTRTLAISGFRLDGKFNMPGYRDQPHVVDIDDLDKITLPHDATREQVRSYITDILVASRRLDDANEHDPQVGMLEKVGSQNVDLLIQMARDNHNYYLNHAVNTLAQPDHKDMIIEALATNHDLIDTIVDHGWQSDAKATLLAVMAQSKPNSGYYSSNWVIAVASLKDPTTYDSLKSYYIEDPNEDVFKALQPLPNFDMAGTVHAAWIKLRTNQAWRTRQVLLPAAQYGEPDAIEVAIKLLKRSDGYSRQEARKALREYTVATGATDADLIAWYEANRANLVFDPQAGKFVVRSSATPPAPAKTGP
jgi:hypothetical protein